MRPDTLIVEASLLSGRRVQCGSDWRWLKDTVCGLSFILLRLSKTVVSR